MKKFLCFLLLFLTSACTHLNAVTPGAWPSPTQDTPPPVSSTPSQPFVPREEKWGIYRLKPGTGTIELIYSSPLVIASLQLNSAGDGFAFSQKVGGENNTDEEIFTMSTDGSGLRRITNNAFRDLYPAWSPDDSMIYFIGEWWSSE